MQEQADHPPQHPLPNHTQQVELDRAIIFSHLYNIRSDLIFNSKYLNPFEIALKEGNPKPQENVSQLPKGIQLVIKTQGFFGNRFKTVQFIHPQKLKQENRDQINLISYLKMVNSIEECKVHEENLETEKEKIVNQKKDGNFLVAICICMYSEDKKMLKETILGVKKNIEELIKKGYSSDSIGVFVIIDGIQSIDPSIFNYITELQNQSLLNFDNFNYYKNGQNILQQQSQTRENCFDKLKFMQDNTNNFIFKENEYKRFTESRLIAVVKQYKQLGKIRELLMKIDYNKQTNISQILQRDLPQRIKKQFFLKEMQKYLLYNQLKTKDINLSEQQYMKYFTQIQTNRQKILILKDTISSALNHIQKYFDSRQKLSYIAPFRIYLQDDYQISFEKNAQYNNSHMNLFLCIKYKNSGKLSSHNWFFNGFCKQLKPKYAILMDVGLVPSKDAIVQMIQQMILNPELGGVCGYMGLKLEKNDREDEPNEDELDLFTYVMGFFVDIQKAQQMEYHISHIIDKSFEALFGFIHVLPGAFSGYNMQVLTSEASVPQRPKKQKETKKQLLQQYFESIQQKLISNRIKPTKLTFLQIFLKIILPQFIFNYFYSIEQQSQQQMLYNQNVYFAEDRILSIQIFKKNKKLGYIPSAYSLVDPIKSIDRLLGQRKRWINGSSFAYQKVKTVMKKMQRCEFMLQLQILFYNFINYLIYLSPSIFFFTINISVRSLNENHLSCFLREYMPKESVDLVLSTILQTSNFIYVLILLILIYYSINVTSKDKTFQKYIYFFSSILGIISMIIILMFIIDSCQNPFLSDPTQKRITNSKSHCNEPQPSQFSPNDASTSLFFLNGNEQWFPSVPKLIMVHKIVTLSIFVFYVLAIVMYSLSFGTFKYIAETIKSTFSFIFYSPTYFIILTLYALCRMDDITWGTKGLDTSSTKQFNLKQKWHQIKLVHVFRYIFWNSAASTAIFILNKQNSPRFYMSFGLVLSIAVIIAVKVIVGLVYMIVFNVKRMKKRQINVQGYINEEKERVMGKILQYFHEQCKIQFQIFLQNLLSCDRNFNRALIAKISPLS